jgi:hypothetical protein
MTVPVTVFWAWLWCTRQVINSSKKKVFFIL